jgi:hypothetical protein
MINKNVLSELQNEQLIDTTHVQRVNQVESDFNILTFNIYGMRLEQNSSGRDEIFKNS